MKWALHRRLRSASYKGDAMAKVVITHNVIDIAKWLQFKSERAEAIAAMGGRNVVDHVAQDGSNTVALAVEVDDVAELMTALSSPRPELGAIMEKHGVVPPLAIYVEQ
jgi:hypothetical protein